MSIRIDSLKGKIIVTFILMVFIFTLLSANILINNYYSIRAYNDLIEDIIVLNAFKHDMDESMQSLDSLLLTRSVVYIDEFYSKNYDATQKLNRLIKRSDIQNNYFMLKDVNNLIESYQGYGEQMYKIALSSNDKTYINKYNDAKNVYKYINASIDDIHSTMLSGEYEKYLDMEKENVNLIISFVVLIGVVFLSNIIFLYVVSKSMIRNINKLTDASYNISKGNFNIPMLQINTNDELEVLANAFNKMIINTKRLMVTIKKKAELEKEAHMIALQSQINPHFLFNTLNVIDKTAIIEEADKTSDLIETLSELLRYNLQKIDRPVTISEELYNLRSYVAIQSVRFGDRISYIEDIDQRCIGFLIPALTLQPIVENSFKHGLEGCESNGIIKLIIQSKGDEINIVIKDNGKGMNFEDRKPDTTGIGMKNIRARLKLFYGEDSYMKIDSGKNGTQVTLVIKKIGENNGQTTISR